MYGLRLFIVVLQELHCLPTFWYVYALVFTDSYQFRVRGAITSPSFVALLLLVSEIAKYIA